jgi:hypothetical protein
MAICSFKCINEVGGGGEEEDKEEEEEEETTLMTSVSEITYRL